MLLVGCGDDDGASPDDAGTRDGRTEPPADGSPPGPDGTTPPTPPTPPGPPPPPPTDAGTDAVVPPDVGPPMPPGDAGPADVRFTVSATDGVHAISPFIYGSNQGDLGARPERRLTLARSGGNRMTAYNWENNASNAGSDWMHQNDDYLGGGDTPGEVVRSFVESTHAAGAAALITIPIVDYVAADKNGGGDVAATPDYLSTRFRQSRARKMAPFTATPDTTDAFVYQDELVAFVDGAFPYHRADPLRRIFFSLDNEPDLWSHTHARIHPDPVGYQELVDRSVEHASAIKDVVPEAVVFGPVSYGWAGYVNLQEAPDAMGRDFLDFYLQQMAAAERTSGRRLLDVLDLHWYPEAQGGGQRIVVDDASDAVAEARMQAPRSLWDDGYTEDSWITMWSTEGPIRLLPRLREKIAAHYPGTRLAFTEYYYGGGGDISGGIAQADVLGAFGREDVFAACLWHLGETDDRFIYGAFRMFRNFDGAGGAFGDVSIAATTDDVERTSVYASMGSTSPDRVVLVAINRANEPLVAAVTVTHGTRFARATVHRLTRDSADPVAGGELPITELNAFGYEMPARSVSTLVLSP
ncbi:MAG: glycoside hydrolase family 44 protein [Deltaproteobacteria bacterium]|nr:glycoside hydrolase family 44 protein [Deltaproteobacteria bacterium]